MQHGFVLLLLATNAAISCKILVKIGPVVSAENSLTHRTLLSRMNFLTLCTILVTVGPVAPEIARVTTEPFWTRRLKSDYLTEYLSNRARQLYKNISMLFLFPVKDGKLSTGVNATFNASCYG